MTYQEIIDTIEAYQENKLDDMRFEAATSYQIGILVTKGIARAFGDVSAFPQLHELYPALFEKPKPEPQKQDSEVIKARLLQYAQYWNTKFRKEGKA